MKKRNFSIKNQNLELKNIKNEIKNRNSEQKVCILTLGCPKNIVDSEFLISSLKNQTIELKNQNLELKNTKNEIKNRKFELTENAEEAEIILLNTCGFLQDSINENFDYIHKIQELKKIKKELKIIVFGCLVSRFASRNNEFLAEKFPLVDKFFPTFSINEILQYLNSNLSISNIRTNLLFSNYSAYLKISDGCNRQCAFCTIPQIKGKYRSRPMAEILAEAEHLAKIGVKELIIIGQETTNYYSDFHKFNSNFNSKNNDKISYSEKINFYNLLSKLSEIKEFQWIRIMYAHPNSFDEKILDLMNQRQNICKYIDIPLQHISENVLNLMQRGTSSQKIKNLLRKMREIVPEIRIRSTFIVGFPGETDENFVELLNFLEEFKLARVGAFKYSAEIGTVGFELANQVSGAIKEERFGKLMELQQKISLEHNKRLKNKEIEVLIEGDFDENYFYGRSEFDAPEIDNGVLIKKHNLTKKTNISSEKINKVNTVAKIGDILRLEVTNYSEYDLICKV